MCYLVPRSVVAEIWAAVALGWRWSFTVCQPGLGIVTRVSMGGLKGGREGSEEGREEGGQEGRKEGWRRERAKQQKTEADKGGRGLWEEEGGQGGAAQCIFVSEQRIFFNYYYFLILQRIRQCREAETLKQVSRV